MSGASPPAAPPRPPRRGGWLVGIAVVVLLVVLALGALVTWLGSEAALAYAVAQISARTGGQLTIRNARGSLLSAVRVEQIALRDPEKSVVANDVSLTWSPLALLHRELHLRELGAREIVVELGESGEPSLPGSLALPLDVSIERAVVGRLDLRSGKARWPMRDIALSYRGGADGHRLANIALAADAGTLAGNLDIGARRPFAVRGAFELVGDAAWHSPKLGVRVDGRLEHLDILAEGSIGEATLQGAAHLDPIAKSPLQDLALTVRNLDLRAFDARFPSTRIAASIKAVPAPDVTLAGSINAENALPGPIDHDRVPLRRLQSEFTLSPDAIVARRLSGVLSDGGRLSGEGTLHLHGGAAGAAASEWALELRDLNLAALQSRLIATHLSGNIAAAITDNVQHIDARVTQDGMAFEGRARVAGTAVDLERFSVRAQGGELAGHGRVDTANGRPFSVDATARGLDPSRFGSFPGALLNGTVTATGRLQPSWSVQGTVALAPGSRWRNVALAGRVTGEFAPDRVREIAADVRAAGATLRAAGSLGRPGDRLRFALDAPRVQELASLIDTARPAQVTGAAQATGTLLGRFDGLGIDLDGHAQRIALGGNSASRIDVKASIAPGSGYTVPALRTRAVTIEARAAQVTWQERTFARIGLDVTGSLAQHTASFAVAGEGVDVTGSATGGFAPAPTASLDTLAWSGTLSRLENHGSYPVRLAGPAMVEASRTRVRVGQARVVLSSGELHVASFDWDQGRISSRGDFSGVPAAAIAQLSGGELPLRTDLVLAGEWNVVANPRLNGSLTVRRERGDVYADTAGVIDTGELPFGLTELILTAGFVDDAVDARATVKASRLGELAATLSMARVAGAAPGRPSPGAPIHGSVQASLASLRPLQPVLGTTAIVDASVRVDLELGGTLAAPTARGTLNATGLRIDAPQYGLFWRDGVLVAHADKDVIRIDQFAVQGGQGRFSVAGSIPIKALTGGSGGERGAQLTWHAEHFRAANRPDLRLIASGDGTVGFAHRRAALKGALHIEEGRIEFGQTPGAKLGDDVVVVGRPRLAPRRRFEDVPLDLDLEVDLGTRLAIAGAGLRTTLEGRARFATTAAGTLTARGTLTTSHGTYAAFGQQLSIERGQVTFDGPIDNPTLDIVALRKNLPVQAGVELTGTVRLPRVQLTSNPPVPDGEKLSWLVLGQGLERTAGTDTAALQAAAAALFARNGPSFGTTLAQRIGLDDLSLRSASGATSGGGPSLENQVVAMSKRITDRLYVVYEAGLSIANNALRIEYALTKSFTLRAQAGTVSTLGIYFLRSFQ